MFLLERSDLRTKKLFNRMVVYRNEITNERFSGRNRDHSAEKYQLLPKIYQFIVQPYTIENFPIL